MQASIYRMNILIVDLYIEKTDYDRIKKITLSCGCSRLNFCRSRVSCA